MKPKPPTEDLVITFAISETTEGKMTINASIPDHAAGTVALLLANMAMDVIRQAMKETTGQEPPMEERRLQ